MSKEPQPVPEEIKPYPFNGYAPGNYMNKCRPCGKMMERVDKLCFVCLECAIKYSYAEISTLQKTIEEQKMEIERLRSVVYYTNKQWHCAFFRATSQMTAREIHDYWVDLLPGFQEKHNL